MASREGEGRGLALRTSDPGSLPGGKRGSANSVIIFENIAGVAQRRLRIGCREKSTRLISGAIEGRDGRKGRMAAS